MENTIFNWLIPIIGVGLGLSILMGSLGCFMLWQRIAFFGDALAHGAFLGAAISLVLHCEMYWGLFLVCIIMTLVLSRFNTLSSDTGLALISYTVLAMGIILVQKLSFKIDPGSYLFGDILSLNNFDLALIWTGVLLAGTYLWYNWSSLLLWSMDPDLAFVDGIKVKKLSQTFLILLAVVVALALKAIGALLVPALLIIPAATARYLSHTPEQMTIYSVIISFVIYILGLGAAVVLEIPSGPAIVIIGIILLLLCRYAKGR